MPNRENSEVRNVCQAITAGAKSLKIPVEALVCRALAELRRTETVKHQDIEELAKKGWLSLPSKVGITLSDEGTESRTSLRSSSFCFRDWTSWSLVRRRRSDKFVSHIVDMAMRSLSASPCAN